MKSIAQLVKMASKVEEPEILFREHVLKIPEKEELTVRQVGARLQDFNRQLYVVSIRP